MDSDSKSPLEGYPRLPVPMRVSLGEVGVIRRRSQCPRCIAGLNIVLVVVGNTYYIRPECQKKDIPAQMAVPSHGCTNVEVSSSGGTS